MRKIAFFASVLMLLGSAACAQKSDKQKGGSGTMTTEMDSLSYVFGASLGQNIRQAEIEGVVPEMVLQGLQDAMKGDESMLISMEEGNEKVSAFMNRRQIEEGKKSQAKADTYMAEEGKKSGYTKTESGILYKVMVAGNGAMPSATDKVRVHYEGRTTDGEVFDSSYSRGQPAEFPLNRVIPGWTEMLQLMNVGSTVEATIPPALAYGERGSPPNIGPNEVLIFKIELIDILKE